MIGGHAVIVNSQDEIIHDPHPSNDGILNREDYINLFVGRK